jgi:hypothetical protein
VVTLHGVAVVTGPGGQEGAGLAGGSLGRAGHPSQPALSIWKPHQLGIPQVAGDRSATRGFREEVGVHAMSTWQW